MNVLPQMQYVAYPFVLKKFSRPVGAWEAKQRSRLAADPAADCSARGKRSDSYAASAASLRLCRFRE
jgi:hypothetical protein